MTTGGIIMYNSSNSGVQTTKTNLDLVVTKKSNDKTIFETTVNEGKTSNKRLDGNTGKMTGNERELTLRGMDYHIFQALLTLDGQPGDLTVNDLKKINTLKGKMGITEATFNEDTYVATIKYGDSVLTIDAESKIERETRLAEEKAAEEAAKNLQVDENNDKSPKLNNPEKSTCEKILLWVLSWFK